MSLGHPDLREYSSIDNPLVSFLQPFSLYEINISYQDKFLNPRAYVSFEMSRRALAPAVTF